MAKKKGRWWLWLVPVLVLGGAIAGVLLVLRTPGQASAASEYLTSEVQQGTLTETVDADFSLAEDATTASLTSPSQGIVTGLWLSEEETVPQMAKVLEVEGVPLYSIVTSVPVYRSLADGDEGEDVAALQEILKAMGYYSLEVDGEYGDYTSEAMTQWQEDMGIDEDEASGSFDLASFFWVKPGMKITELTVGVGDKIEGDGTIATLGGGSRYIAKVGVSQLDIGQIEVGQAVTLAFDSLEGTGAGTVEEVSKQASEDSASGSVEYEVTIAIDEVPAKALLGMTGTATIVIDQVEDALIVPSSAITGSGEAATVSVLVDGQAEVRSVTVGLVTASGAEVLSGLAAGEEVITGTLADLQDSGSGSSTGGVFTINNGSPAGAFPGGVAPSGGSRQFQRSEESQENRGGSGPSSGGSD